jgi:ribosomal 50S subunit-recycling heat shock protein
MKILFEDGVCEDVDVTELSSGVVRLEETPLASSSELRFGDVIELEQDDQRIWKYVRLSKRADHESASVLLSHDVADSRELENVLADITQQGVHWERAFGGILFVHGPPEQVAHARTLITSLNQRSDPGPTPPAGSDPRMSGP